MSEVVGAFSHHIQKYEQWQSNLFTQTQHIHSQLIHSWQHVSVLVNHLQATF